MHVSTGLILFRKQRHGNFSLCSWAWSQWAEHLVQEYLLFLNVPKEVFKKKKFLYIKEDQFSVEVYSFFLTRE